MRMQSTRYKQGSISKRKNKNGEVWRYRYTDVEGNAKVITFDKRMYPNEADVLRATAKIREEINPYKTPSERVRYSCITVPVALEKYLISIEPEIRPRTRSTYRNHANKIAHAYEGIELDNLDSFQIETWVKSLPLAPSQKANVRILFRCAIHLAMRSKACNLKFNPAEFRLKGRTLRQKQIYILTPTQFIQLVKATRKPYDRIVMVCGFLGLRIGECLALQWADFDMQTGTVEIQRSISCGHLTGTKTGKSHAALPIPDALMTYIQEWKSDTINEWLFPSPTSASGIHGHSSILMQKVLHPACDSIGIPHIGWHTLRHSYRSWLNAAGVTVGTSKDMMRHADISTTMNTYGRTLPAGMKEAADAIAALIQ